MLYKYLSPTPFLQDKKEVIRFGDIIEPCDYNQINNITSNRIISFNNLDYNKHLGWILDHSSEIEEESDTKELDTIDDVESADKYMISRELYERLNILGILNTDVRSKNVGASDYSQHLIQPWSIWRDYNLDPWDADIIKRVLRTKSEPGKSADESRVMDYQKIIHICQEKIRQLTCNKNL